ncbi:helix-turn-helix domain-containing protein [Paenibacillus sp. FJAT-26967]|uniref:helix-turn-helix domain-containing protein n=1 Tax=Paenibacillus sp. FJAT-26967 TaxID=1729690 RepID=UPI0008385077|nr:helix-turn-helix domain-containing protein [Paenibacillus sp. FJAT-26967]
MQPAPPTSNKGILKYSQGREKFSMTRVIPSRDLRPFITHYWLIAWDLRGQNSYRQEVLQHPGVNLVFERGETCVHGVRKGRSSYLLQEQGEVFGILFRPGGFHPFLQEPISSLTDQSVPLNLLFDVDSDALEETLFSMETESDRIQVVERFLRNQHPKRDSQIEFINEIVHYIIEHREINRVEDIAVHFSLSPRTLQRMFNLYVGVSPKWVIQRSRIQDAVELADGGVTPEWSKLALDLGYYDQAHFIKDFKTVVGSSPHEYAINGIK